MGIPKNRKYSCRFNKGWFNFNLKEFEENPEDYTQIELSKYKKEYESFRQDINELEKKDEMCIISREEIKDYGIPERNSNTLTKIFEEQEKFLRFLRRKEGLTKKTQKNLILWNAYIKLMKNLTNYEGTLIYRYNDYNTNNPQKINDNLKIGA